ncbi:hypothetical protein [Streptomyces sp. NPDC050738]|uniref:hypothetical protein n=1 Tax=Streptomyces sp. NPDC050738 TaxID=3154744 RepID=UPI00342F4337
MESVPGAGRAAGIRSSGTAEADPGGGGGGDAGAQGGKSPSGGAGSGSASASASATGPVFPYGSTTGLTGALSACQCVSAVWPGEAFKGTPNPGVVNCADAWPDGQAMALEKFADADADADAAAAGREGADRCRTRTAKDVAALPDAGVYALIPTTDGFDAAGGQVVCLVLGRHAAIGSEVGAFRDPGLDLPPQEGRRQRHQALRQCLRIQLGTRRGQGDARLAAVGGRLERRVHQGDLHGGAGGREERDGGAGAGAGAGEGAGAGAGAGVKGL